MGKLLYRITSFVKLALFDSMTMEIRLRFAARMPAREIITHVQRLQKVLHVIVLIVSFTD